VTGTSITLDQAVEVTRTGDIWIFRGRKMADRMIRISTNSPVNHVGMAVVLDDLPPLMWHAELGKSLVDMWSGVRQRGVQLHDLRESALVWTTKYGQQAWMRQLEQPVNKDAEDALLRTIARLDGLPFPSTARLATKWLRGRARVGRHQQVEAAETAYCAEVVTTTYQAMELLPSDRHPTWYDAGRFWSGDELRLADGYRLSDEIAIEVDLGISPASR
jgi:hypothetical protein